MTRPPSQGEVDIVEGVNDQGPNASSLHTGPGMWLAITAITQFVMDRTELAFRVHYATCSLRDRVNVHLRIHVVEVIADTTISFSLCPTVPPPDRTATLIPTAMLVVACRPLSQTTVDPHSTIMAADGT